MRAAAREVVAWLGLPRLLGRVAPGGRLTIVMYHAVVPSPLPVGDWCFLDEESFRRHAEYLGRHFEVVFLSEAVARLKAGALRRPTAALTFDDGFQNNRDVVLPILRERGLPATVFLTTGLVGSDDTVWYCRLNRALAETGRRWLDWGGERFDLSGPGPRARAGKALQARLKILAHPRLLAELLWIVRELREETEPPVEVGSPYRMLSGAAVAEMAASGVVEFGAHTHSHAILARLSPEERDGEIEASLAAVRELTGGPCRLFSYPNGQLEDYDPATIGALRERGVEAAVTSMAGANEETTPAMELRRYGIGAGVTMARFQLMVHHWAWPFLRRPRL